MSSSNGSSNIDTKLMKDLQAKKVYYLNEVDKYKFRKIGGNNNK